MTLEHFNNQIERLKKAFPDPRDNLYNNERLRLFFLDLGDYPDHYMERAVNYFMMAFRNGPLLKDFLEVFARFESEAKFENAVAVSDILRLAIPRSADPEFGRLCKSVIDQKVSFSITDVQYEQAVAHITTHAARTCDKSERCPDCYGTGMAHRSGKNYGDTVYRCYCPDGAKHPETIPSPSKKNEPGEPVKMLTLPRSFA